MVTIYYFSCSEYNTTFGMGHLFSNYSIERVISINLVNFLDFTHCSSRALSPSVQKQKYYFIDGASFWHIIWVGVLRWNLSVSYPSIPWVLGAVTLWWSFMGVSKYCDSSSTVIFVSNIFVVCGIDTGLVSMRSYVLSFTAVLVLEYASVVNCYLLATSMFPIEL